MKPGLTPSLNKYTSAPIKAHDTFCWSCVLICGYVVDIFKPEMNMASLDFSDGTQKYHRDSIKNVCTDMEHFKSHSILYLLTAVALNVKIGLIKDSSTTKVLLRNGDTLWGTFWITLHGKVSWEYWVAGPHERLWGCRVWQQDLLDGRLVSLQAKENGAEFLVTEVESIGS